VPEDLQDFDASRCILVDAFDKMEAKMGDLNETGSYAPAATRPSAMALREKREDYLNEVGM
jgi:hypothetical protein